MDWGQKCPTQPKLFLVSAGAILVRVGQNECRPSWSYLQPPVGNLSWPFPKGKECEKGSEPESRCEETAF